MISNLAILSWVQGGSPTSFFSSILVYRSSTGTPIPMSISPAKQTSASPERLLLPPLTATWAWSLDGETTWSHPPTFSYISFVALYLGNICLDHRASSSTNNEQSQGNCAVVFQQSLLLFSNIVAHLASKRFWTTDICAIFSRVCHHGRV